MIIQHWVVSREQIGATFEVTPAGPRLRLVLSTSGSLKIERLRVVPANENLAQNLDPTEDASPCLSRGKIDYVERLQ